MGPYHWWRQGSRHKFSYTWCKMNKCQLAKKLHMMLINLHLVLAILFGSQCVLKVWIYTWWYGSGTSLHMVVVPFINVTLGARTKCVIHWREPGWRIVFINKKRSHSKIKWKWSALLTKNTNGKLLSHAPNWGWPRKRHYSEVMFRGEVQ